MSSDEVLDLTADVFYFIIFYSMSGSWTEISTDTGATQPIANTGASSCI